MGFCGTCEKGEDFANIVNELLWNGTRLADVAEQVGSTKSSIHRHQHGRCPFSYLKWKANRARNKGKIIGRQITQWEDGSLSHYGEPIEEKDLRGNDVIFFVAYAPPLPPVSIDYEDALVENAARDAAKLAEETADAGNSPHL